MKRPRKTWPRLSIRGKLIVAFGLFGVVPVAAWGGYAALRAFELLRDGVQHRLETEVVLKAEGIQRLLDDAGRDVRFVSRLPTLRALVELPPERLTADHPLAGPVGEAMLSFSRARPTYSQVRYLDQAGREIVRVDTDGLAPRLLSARDLQDKADRYYFRDAMRMAPDGVYVSPMDLNVEHGAVETPYRAVLRYAVRLDTRRGDARGVVVINVDAADVLRQILALAREPYEILLLDARGYYLAGAEAAGAHGDGRPGAPGWLVAHGDRIESAMAPPQSRPVRRVSEDLAAPVVAQMLAARTGTVDEPGLSGRIVAFAPIFPRTGDPRDFWVLARVHRKWQVLSAIRSLQVLLGGLGLGVIGLALVAGVAAARHFTRPISALIDGARAIADGDFERPIRVDTGDELEDLAQQFDGMAARLKAHQHALSEARQRAERKAQESQALSRIATEMLGLLALPQILQLVADKARELMQADLAFLSLHEGEDGLRLAATSGVADTLMPRLGASMADVPCAEGSCCQQARCPILVSTPFGRHATTPLRSGDRVLGYLCVGFRTARADQTEAPEALAGLASQAAIAIEKARLHEDVRSLERLESVLVVDDHEVVREGLRALLGRTPTLAVVGEAGTAADAVALARRHRPDVVLLDIRLPDGSGVEVCREIRAEVPETRVLMLTSYADDEAVFASIVAGAAGYLLKQVRGHELVRAIEAVAAGQSLLDPTVTPSVLAKMKALATGGPRDELTALSTQEERVLELVAAGKTNKEIAAVLGLSDKTVKNYLSRVFEKLHLTRRAEAAALFTRRQVLQSERSEGRSPSPR